MADKYTAQEGTRSFQEGPDTTVYEPRGTRDGSTTNYAPTPGGNAPQRDTNSNSGGGSSPRETTMKAVGGGSSIEALCGLGAVVLAILGLSHVLPLDLAAVTLIAAGAGLVIQGGAVAARFQQMRDMAESQDGRRGVAEVEGGMTAEMVGGIAAVVLGILALIHIAPLVLLQVGVIVLGATLLLGAGATHEAAELPTPDLNGRNDYAVAHRAASSAAGADVLIGLGAITLGILALCGVANGDAPVLSLVALLAVGVAELLSGGVLSYRMGRMFHHHGHA